MAHPQELRDKAQEYADRFYAFFPYPALVVYGTLYGYPFYSASSWSDGNFGPFIGTLQETVVGDGASFAVSALFTGLMRNCADQQGMDPGQAFELEVPNEAALLAQLESMGVTEPTAIARGESLHRPLEALSGVVPDHVRQGPTRERVPRCGVGPARKLVLVPTHRRPGHRRLNGERGLDQRYGLRS